MERSRGRWMAIIIPRIGRIMKRAPVIIRPLKLRKQL